MTSPLIKRTFKKDYVDVSNLAIGEKKMVPLEIYNKINNQTTSYDNLVCVSRQYITQHVGTGSTTFKGKGYVFEAKIPFKYLKGISNTEGQNITLANTNLWSGTLQVTGGSTGPIVLASTGFVIAIIAVLKYSGFSFKKRRTL